MAETLEAVKTVETLVEVKKSNTLYPAVEEMTFRAIVADEKEAYALLRAIQILVNELGATQIIQLMNKVEQKPSILQQARNYLPYILKL